jgi:hypothetical protein
MQINSKDGCSYIIIEQKFDETYSYSSFNTIVKVDIGHGKFIAENHDLQFLRVPEFIKNLKKLNLDDNKKVTLEGTYGSYLQVIKNKSEIILEFCIGDCFCSTIAHDYKFSGSFVIDFEQLERIINGFKKIEEQKY